MAGYGRFTANGKFRQMHSDLDLLYHQVAVCLCAREVERGLGEERERHIEMEGEKGREGEMERFRWAF